VPNTPPPLLGFNNNVRHRGRVFHIQTEDSGTKRPHVTTHLFADGGRILKSVRTDYAEHVGLPEMSATVKRLMKEQHKAMFVALRSGELDSVIESVFGPVSAPEQPPAEADPAPPAQPVDTDARVLPTPEELAARIATPLPKEWQRPAEAPVAGVLEEPEPAPPTRPATVPPSSVPRIPTPPPPSQSIDQAVQAMAEKAAGLPPRSSTPIQGSALTAPSPLQKRRAADSQPGRYSISRPPAIFGDAPVPDSRSIFGDPLIGEKSLDEVILSYLAEDLEK
jgi:hypothetical protein